jgi:threonyl-tRNA synthetase
MIRITLPDSSVREFEEGVTGMEIARSISQGLARNALGIYVNDQPYDLSRTITEDAFVRIVTFGDDDGKAIFWHSSAHLMAEAIEALYPGTRFGIGPPLENGFYYDMEIAGGHALSIEDLEKIERKMTELAKADNAFERIPVSWEEAVAFFQEKGDHFKLELLEEFKDREITLYRQGNFTDLCRGTHIPSTGMIKALKLLSVSAAYWRGDAKRQAMQRVYGVTFPKKTMLDEHLTMLEEAKKRDHRKLGRELELFLITPNVGLGLPIWLPKGTVLRETLETFLRAEQRRRGYSPVVTPHIGNLDMYRTSGHYPYYAESQFTPITVDEEEYLLKPMNCPHHCQIFASRPRSYRELPVRLAEFGTVYRYEKPGELKGLTRVRGFTVDDAHLFIRPDQVHEELTGVLDLIKFVMSVLGFHDFKVRLSLSDPDNREKYVGAPELWETAERALQDVAEASGLSYTIGIGEAAFYGPKIDFMVRDAIGRSWQLGTVQLDYNLPERFNLEYTGQDGSKHRPVMIHRAPFGSLERFIGVLIEHYAGNFPFWLAPVQVRILPISEHYLEYGAEVNARLVAAGFRSELDEANEKIGYKIREAEMQKVPYMLIVGEKERDAGSVSVRVHGEGDRGMETIENLIVEFTRHNDLQRIAAEAMAAGVVDVSTRIDEETIEHAVPDARS